MTAQYLDYEGEGGGVGVSNSNNNLTPLLWSVLHPPKAYTPLDFGLTWLSKIVMWGERQMNPTNERWFI